MRKITVIFFLICSAFGQWQQSDEIALPKGIQVNDLVINSSGELWILSASSILKYERAAKNPFLVQEIDGGKAFTVIDEVVYVVDKGSRLLSLDLAREGLVTSGNLVFNSPTQISHTILDTKPIIIVQEPGRLVFTDSRNLIGNINTSAERFSAISGADYDNDKTPFFTLTGNRIYSWTGGTISNPQDYKKEIFFSATHKIIDFNTAQNGDVFVLFSDSIIVLAADGSYKTKADIDKIHPGSRLLTSTDNNTVTVYDHTFNTLKTLKGLELTPKNDIIVLRNNHPNPVDNYTEIEFTLGQFLDLSITIYNLIGEPVKVIAKGRFAKGNHKVVWHGKDEGNNLVPNGIYFYRLESKKGVAIKQLTVLR